MSNRVRVLATLRAQEGKEEELGALLRGLLEPTRAEEGCLKYELWRNEAESGEFTFVEEWRSAEALAAHFETEHIQAGRAKLPDLLDGEMDLRTHDLVG